MDVDYYHSLARSLVAGKGFVAQRGDRELPNIDRPPVYPVFLAGLIRLGGDRLGWILVIQCVLGAITACLTVVLALRWVDWKPAAAAGLLVALDPMSVMRCLSMMPETLMTLLLLLTTCVLTFYRDSCWAWIAAGMLGGLVALIRAFTVWIFVVILPVARWWRCRWCHLGMFAVIYTLIISVWIVRNAVITGHAFLSINSRQHWVSMAADCEARKTGHPFEQVWQEYQFRYGDLYFFNDRTSFERALEQYGRVGRNFVLAEPTFIARQEVIGPFRVMLAPGRANLQQAYKRVVPPTRWWPPLYSVALAVAWTLAAYGAIRFHRETALLTGLILYVIVLAGPTTGSSRFRTMISPMVAVLTVAGASAIRNSGFLSTTTAKSSIAE